MLENLFGAKEGVSAMSTKRKKMNRDWKTQQFIRMWPRALFHMKDGMKVLNDTLTVPGVYVLYREDQPYYIGKTSTTLLNRLRNHALKPNARRYNFWNDFSAFAVSHLRAP